MAAAANGRWRRLPRARTWIAGALALATSGLATLSSTPADAALRSTQILSGVQELIYATSPPNDARLFLVERRGRIRIYSGGVLLPTAFLDIRSQVASSGEQGMLSVAFPSDYASSGLFYVLYSELGGATVISRFRVQPGNPDLADAASEEILLFVPQDSLQHKGGTIAFSPVDGYLYFACGDGGEGDDPFERAQDPQRLAGKMLRIDVSGGLGSGYSIPPDNPFVGAADPMNQVRDEIWAFGFRNPFRFAFDRLTGDIWIGDVGQAEREEVDFEPAGTPGRNYGWDVWEGSIPHGFDPAPALAAASPVHTPPVYEYDHAVGCSITGGVLSRGSIPEIFGRYLFGDWCTGSIWTLDPATLAVTDRTAETGALSQVVGFHETSGGALYAVSVLGRLYRIEGGDPGDADGDGIDDELDPCTVLSGAPPPVEPPSQQPRRALLAIANVDGGPGDERLGLRGQFNPADPTGIDPSSRGVHVRLSDSDGTLFEVDVPGGLRGDPGACGDRDGWRVRSTGAGPVWTYRNVSGALPSSGCAPGSAAGLRAIAIRDRRSTRTQAFQFSVSVVRGSLPRAPVFPVTRMQLARALALRDDPGAGLVSSEARSGRCAEALFSGSPVPTARVPRRDGGPLPFCKRIPASGTLRKVVCDGL